MNNKGYTVLGLIVSMTMVCLILALALVILTLSFKYGTKAKQEITLESHFRHTLVFLEKNIETQSNIVSVRGSTDASSVKDMTDTSNRILLSSIRLENKYKEYIGDKNDCFNLYVKPSKTTGKKSLKYNKKFSGTQMMECANNIDRVYIEPIPKKVPYAKASGIKFIFKNDLDIEGVYEYEKSIYFKNKKHP